MDATTLGAMLPHLVAGLVPSLIELRRALHRHPELGFKEFETTKRIVAALDSHGIPVNVRESGAGAWIELGAGDRLVAYRADIDGLPLEEESGVSFASENPGVMHACGHDAHTAIGVGVAAALAGMGELPGRVRIIFQPAEEVFPGGAEVMLEEHVLEGVERIIAMHVDPSLETGCIGLKPGAITSSSDRFTITLRGPGGHTSRPHESPDTVFAAGKIITELEGLLSRHIDARTPRAVVFGAIHGGEAANVIPASVRLTGTVRVAGMALWDEIGPLLTELVPQIVSPTGVEAEIEYEKGLGPVNNDPDVVWAVEHAAVKVLSPHSVLSTYTSMGAEDFSVFTNAVPGALIRLGCKIDGRPARLHSARFDLDEDAIRVGTLVGAAAVLRLLED